MGPAVPGHLLERTETQVIYLLWAFVLLNMFAPNPCNEGRLLPFCFHQHMNSELSGSVGTGLCYNIFNEAEVDESKIHPVPLAKLQKRPRLGPDV